MIVFNLPRWIVDNIYDGILDRDCVIRTMSVDIKDHYIDGPKFTGGAKSLKSPLHYNYIDYVSIQDYTNMLQSGLHINDDKAQYWNSR